MKNLFQIVLMWLMKRFSPRFQRNPSDVLRTSTPDSNLKMRPIEDSAADQHPEATTGRASEGQLVDAAAASTAPPGAPVFTSRDGKPEATNFERTPRSSAVIEPQPCQDEAPVEDPQTAKEEHKVPETAAVGQPLRANEDEPQKAETLGPAIASVIEPQPCQDEAPVEDPQTAKEEHKVPETAAVGQPLRANEDEPQKAETLGPAIASVIEPQPCQDEAPVEDPQTAKEEHKVPETAAVGQPLRANEDEPQKAETLGPAIASVIEPQPCQDEAPVEDPQTAKEEHKVPETAAVGQPLRANEDEPQKAETLGPAIGACSLTLDGGPCVVPSLSGPPPGGNGLGTGSDAALEAVGSSSVTEEHAAPVPSEDVKAVAANKRGELAIQDVSGTGVITNGNATWLSLASPKKAPTLESGWEAYSERPAGGPGKPQPAARSTTAKGVDTSLQTTTKTTETEPEPPECDQESPEPLDISEYNGPGVASLPDHYLWWNRILLERFISVAASGDILLATTPRVLAAALFDGEDQHVSPTEAEKRFAEAIAAGYKVAVVSPARLKVFRRVCSDGFPICVAFLALSVLAAHKMHMDETTWSSDYYSRLAELLGVSEGANGQPVGFRTNEFESLWLFLADWVSKKTGRSLVLPPGNAQKRYIAYPLAHVPLRQLDLEKLPSFFEWAGYSSENLPGTERLEDDLRRWDQSYGSFSNAGRDALNDSRVGAVLTQVRSELRAWDGVVSDSTGIRYSQVEILLETIGRRSNLALLAPRREAFPETFSCGDIQLSGGDSWYDPLPLKPGDGALLLEGFSWPSEDRPSCVLRRAPGLVFVLAPNAEYSDLVSRNGLPKDITSAVLCHQSLLDAVGSYLASICHTAPRHFHDSSLPDGWFLFLGVRAIRRAEIVPEELRALEVATEVNIIPCGGLRLGGRWAWLEGTAPRLLIEGHDGQTVTVNDLPADLSEDGYIKPEDAFANAGEYVVKIGSFERKVRILKPRLRPSAAPILPVDGTKKVPHSVIVEAGQWNLIGSFPGDIKTIEANGLGSSLFFCDFEPVWAVKLSVRKTGTRLIELVRKPVEISVNELLKMRAQAIRGTKNRAAAHRWASTIHAANCRRPVVECGSGNQDKEPGKSWDEYVRIARVIKRLSKSGVL